ncbi:MAG: hypothetical protein R2883_00135 [Caldisericia bacterium]
MLRIDALYYYGYMYHYTWGCSGSSSYTAVRFNRVPQLNHDQYSYSGTSYWYAYGYDIMTRVQQGLLLDCVLGIDCAGTPVIPVGYQPGDFVYFQQNPASNLIQEGDIRLSNVDSHRDATGYIIGQGCMGI